MKELQIFNNKEFGQIRTVEIDGKPYFVANDIAKALGYSNPSKATNDHCKKAIKRWGNDSLGRRQEFKVIPEGDLYRLMTHSKLDSAEKFESWVFDEVLPSLRKTGSYEMPKKKNLSSINMLAKNITNIFTKAGVEPVLVAAEVKRLYKEQADIEIQIPLLTDKGTMSKLYDCTEIARELGIMSKSGNPHNQAVGDIIRKLDITEDETKTTAFSRNGHDDVTVQYLPSVVEKVRAWLEENFYPAKIPYVDSKGNSKTRTVVYLE